MKTTTLIALGILAGLSIQKANADWKMKHAPLMTKWAAEVDAKAPLPEYPRPQMVRKDWLNLNGIWEYQPGKEGDATRVGQKLASEILVPFPVESAISGVMEHHDRLWYRRMFTVPAGWNGKRILLHFGAVDYESEVFVNGKSVGVHKGGYDPFSYDITDALKGSGDQELIVRAFDPTNDGGQPRGKQSIRPGGIMYTPTTGIWQTVWLEPIAVGGIKSLKIVPDIDASLVKISAQAMENAAAASRVTISVKDGETVVGSASGKPGDEVTIKIPDAKLWSPDSPHLYDVSVAIGENANSTDSVTSYFGMRKSSLGEVNGIKKTFLNNKFFWQIGPLDQGFWPDGLYTPPTEDALKFDIQTTKDLGFNMIRKHIKVEPARWYYWCDKIGLAVWQDMPSANSYDDHPTPPVDKEAYKRELTAMIEALRNEPCIIQWEVFNEGQGQHDTKELVALVKELDPTRLVNQASGGEHKGAGDIFDIHPYPAPQMPKPNDHMALAIGEFGGIGRMVKSHLWAGTNGGYMNIDTPQELIDTYATFTHLLKGFRDEHGLSAAVYTQITDVETELNGLLTYDRVPKMDIAQIAKANRFEIQGPTYTTIVPTSEKESQTWKYTFDKPADGWRNKTFDDKAWKEGKGGFGAEGTPNIGKLGTEWKTNDIWMRRTFKLDATNKQIDDLLVRVYHDEDVEVFINGVKAFEASGFDSRYANRPLTPEARRVLKANDENTIAVHCRQTIGGQYVDVGFSVRDEAKP